MLTLEQEIKLVHKMTKKENISLIQQNIKLTHKKSDEDMHYCNIPSSPIIK